MGTARRGSRSPSAVRSVALLLAALVVSHWALDAASHRPDAAVAGRPGRRPGVVELGPADARRRGSTLFGLAVWLYAARAQARPELLADGRDGCCSSTSRTVFGPRRRGVTAIGASGVVAVPLLWWWAARAGADAT